ncbi:MAG: DUF4407 domain-containing protein [Flavobacteriales bacterium]
MNKLLKIFCGFDLYILSRIKRNDFVLYFFLLILIVILSFVSLLKAVSEISENNYVMIIIATFFSLFILNLYRLILSSLKRGDVKYESGTNFQKLFPHLIKFISLLILALMISYPLEVLIFKNKINPHLVKYRSELVKDYSRTIEKIQLKNIEEMTTAYENEKEFLILINEPDKIVNVKELEKKIVLIENQIDLDIKEYRKVVNKSSFFAQKINILNKKIPSSYLFTILMIALFYYPLILLLLSNEFIEYFNLKNKINRSLVENKYSKFVELRDQLFVESTGSKRVISTKFSDPPFNLIPIKNNIKNFKKGSLIEWLNTNNSN